MAFKNFWYPKYNEGNTILIMEGGINAAGDIDCAKRMIALAAVCGFNVIKWQKRTPRLAVPEDQKNKIKETPDGPMTYLEYKEIVEFSINDCRILLNYAKFMEIQMSFSVWDMEALSDITSNFTDDIPWIKIPSAKLTDTKLVSETLNWAKQNSKQILVSCGMSTDREIDELIQLSKQILGSNFQDLFVILTCHSAYPADVHELNLNQINVFKEKYGIKYVGWSNHATRIIPTIASVYKGATHVEVHGTLSRDMWGSDQLSSLEPAGLFNFTSGARLLEFSEGDGVHKLYDSELASRSRLRG